MSSEGMLEVNRSAEAVACPILPYELRIGVTGHRSIDDPAAVMNAVRDVNRILTATLSQSSIVPLHCTIVSPLAAGADQIVAEVFLESNAALEVILPFELEEYRRDFENPDDLERFERLRQRGKVHRFNSTRPDEDATDQTLSRDFAYLLAGYDVVDTSEIVIAVWDGAKAAGPGGTAEVVEYALSHGRTVLWIDPSNPRREPLVIRSMRWRGGQARIRTATLRSAAEQLSQGYALQLAYCVDSRVSAAAIARATEAAANALTATAQREGLPPSDLQPIVQTLPQFVRADLLAQFYQRRHIFATEAVILLAATAVTVAAVQILFFTGTHWILSFELLAMAGALALWKFSRQSRWHEKWLQARYLAERLRVTMFACLVEIPPSMLLAETLPFYPGPQNWLRCVVDRVARLADAARTSPASAPMREFLAHAWLRDQQIFHNRNAHRLSRRVHRLHRAGLVLFALTFIAGALHLLDVGDGSHFAENSISLLALVLPVWAGSFHALTTQLEIERVADRSRRMVQSLNRMVAMIVVARTPEDLRKTIREAVHLMATETHEWWVLLSFQNVRLHV